MAIEHPGAREGGVFFVCRNTGAKAARPSLRTYCPAFPPIIGSGPLSYNFSGNTPPRIPTFLRSLTMAGILPDLPNRPTKRSRTPKALDPWRALPGPGQLIQVWVPTGWRVVLKRDRPGRPPKRPPSIERALARAEGRGVTAAHAAVAGQRGIDLASAKRADARERTRRK